MDSSPRPPPDRMEQLTVAVSRIHLARSTAEALQLLVDAARDLVGARQAALLVELGSGPPLRVRSPLDSGADEVAGVTMQLTSSEGTRVGDLEVHGPRGGSLMDADQARLAQLAQLGFQALESVRLRERLVDQEERLRLALEAASLGTWEHLPDAHATTWDARCKEMFGLGPEEPLDYERYATAIHPDDRAHVFAGITKATDPHGSGECSLQYRITSANGDELWVEAHGRCIFVDGRPVRINGTLLDITARKQGEQALREASQRKDAFLAILGHELRNPLAPIRTALDLMARRDPDQFAHERTIIDRHVRHMIRLVDDLLDLSRITRGSITLRRERVELSTGVASALEIAGPLFDERGHHLTVDVPEGLVLEADPVRLAQIVANLLTNAARYTGPGGRIEVAARRDGDAVVLAVRDDGIGLVDAQIPEIFEPFVQVQRTDEQVRGGLGLGLPLVRDLVQLHGGTVEASSAGPGHGSEFVVRLPAAAGELHASPQAQLAPAAAGPGKRILVVDDNEDAANLLADLLGIFGHQVEVATDGPRALDVAERFKPQVAILDLGLPVMDGCELARRLRSGHPDLRLVALTGYGQAGDRERTAQAGFEVHLVKPVDLSELERALEHSEPERPGVVLVERQ